MFEYLKSALIKLFDLEKVNLTKNETFNYIDDTIIDYRYRNKNDIKNYYIRNEYINFKVEYIKIHSLTCCTVAGIIIPDPNKMYYNDVEFELRNNKLFDFYDNIEDKYVEIDDYNSFNIITELTDEERFYLALKYQNIGDIIG